MTANVRNAETHLTEMDDVQLLVTNARFVSDGITLNQCVLEKIIFQ